MADAKDALETLELVKRVSTAINAAVEPIVLDRMLAELQISIERGKLVADTFDADEARQLIASLTETVQKLIAIQIPVR